jgi:ABC-type dipeptide/oligopeptide/nickel transport system permease component
LSICAIIFAVALGVPAGVLAAVKRGSFWDQTIMTTALVGFSMPIFWWGLMLIILFSGHAWLDACLGTHLADVLLPERDRLHD